MRSAEPRELRHEMPKNSGTRCLGIRAGDAREVGESPRLSQGAWFDECLPSNECLPSSQWMVAKELRDEAGGGCSAVARGARTR